MTVLASPPTQLVDYDLDGGRCAAEVVMTVSGIPLWRVRLRLIAVRLALPAEGSDDVGRLVAHGAVAPQFASLPFARRWFMPRSDRSDLVTFSVAGLPALHGDDRVDVSGLASVGERSWSVDLAMRVFEVGEQVVLAARGPVQRPIADSLPSTCVYVDIAAELQQCA